MFHEFNPVPYGKTNDIGNILCWEFVRLLLPISDTIEVELEYNCIGYVRQHDALWRYPKEHFK